MEMEMEMAESFQLREEIQSLMAEEADLHPGLGCAPPVHGGSSFTALLGLPPTQALELLHGPGPECPRWADQKPPCLPVVDREAQFSVFTGESPETSSGPSNGSESSIKPKAEAIDSESNPNFPEVEMEKQRLGKRKGAGGEKSKVKGAAKRSRNAENGSSEKREKSKDGEEKPPHVHVRARRGEATDSHSLAERARREKINARMKLLQDLVPGCNKISGTALVLDEIINHVQSLQRQVEFLSMRLAAVNPRIDFSNFDSFFPSDNGDLTAGNVASMVAMDPSVWSHVQVSGARRQQQLWHIDLLPSSQRDEGQVLMTRENALVGYDSAYSVGTVAQPPNVLKMEL